MLFVDSLGFPVVWYSEQYAFAMNVISHNWQKVIQCNALIILSSSKHRFKINFIHTPFACRQIRYYVDRTRIEDNERGSRWPLFTTDSNFLECLAKFMNDYLFIQKPQSTAEYCGCQGDCQCPQHTWLCLLPSVHDLIGIRGCITSGAGMQVAGACTSLFP